MSVAGLIHAGVRRSRQSRRTVRALLVLLAVACDQTGRSPAGRTHPTPENFPRPDELADRIPRTPRREHSPQSVLALAEAWAAVDTLAAVGDPDGAPGSGFGLVQDAAFASDSLFLALDSRYNIVTGVTSSGTIDFVVGGPGAGPAEFQAPQALDVLRGGQVIAVADRHLAIKIFRLAEPNGYAYQRTVRLDFVPEDFCVMGELLVAQGWRPGLGLVHVHDDSGRYVRSFGETYRASTEFVESQLSDARMGCLEEAGLVVVALENVPVIRAYDLNGLLRWQSQLISFTPVTIRERTGPNGGPAISYEGGEFDVMHTITAIPGGGVLVQTAHHTRESIAARRRWARVDSYILDSSTGRGTWVGAGLPAVSAVRAGLALAASEDPTPQLLILKAKPGGRP